MKYFIDVTIIDLATNNVTQKMNYDVNHEDNEVITIEMVKAELLQWVTIKSDSILVNEKIEVKGHKKEDSFVIADKTLVYYTAYLQKQVKNQK